MTLFIPDTRTHGFPPLVSVSSFAPVPLYVPHVHEIPVISVFGVAPEPFQTRRAVELAPESRYVAINVNVEDVHDALPPVVAVTANVLPRLAVGSSAEVP